MKNTYILVREGENENGPQRWFFSIKDVSDYFERDVKYVSALMTGRIRKGYIVHKGKVNYLKRLPCGEPQYEMQRALEKQLNALKFMKMGGEDDEPDGVVVMNRVENVKGSEKVKGVKKVKIVDNVGDVEKVKRNRKVKSDVVDKVDKVDDVDNGGSIYRSGLSWLR